jgi:hypothetical protein
MLRTTGRMSSVDLLFKIIVVGLLSCLGFVFVWDCLKLKVGKMIFLVFRMVVYSKSCIELKVMILLYRCIFVYLAVIKYWLSASVPLGFAQDEEQWQRP